MTKEAGKPIRKIIVKKQIKNRIFIKVFHKNLFEKAENTYFISAAKHFSDMITHQSQTYKAFAFPVQQEAFKPSSDKEHS